jgi:uncharacterized protein YndB with AHSA1/START domain
LSRNEILISATPDEVFDVLDDAHAYPRWVVGTRRIRNVDSDWPAPGSRFHHAVGNAAAELHDSSKVLDRERPEHITLEVRFRPTGVARVSIGVRSVARGSKLVLEEDPQSGPVAAVPRFLTEPLLWVRNAISLQRLRHEVERRAHRTGGAGEADSQPASPPTSGRGTSTTTAR